MAGWGRGNHLVSTSARRLELFVNASSGFLLSVHVHTHERREMTRIHTRHATRCQNCGSFFESYRSTARFCSTRCRCHAWRNGTTYDPMTTKETVEQPQTRPSMGMWTLADIWRQQNGLCHRCHQPLIAETMVPSWILAPQQGGEISKRNRTLLCKACTH
jgi:hypothetical protein